MMNVGKEKYFNSLRHRVKSVFSTPLSHCSKLIRFDQSFYSVSSSVNYQSVPGIGYDFSCKI